MRVRLLLGQDSVEAPGFVAAFNADGDCIGGIGEMTSELVTALPLPRTLSAGLVKCKPSRERARHVRPLSPRQPQR